MISRVGAIDSEGCDLATEAAESRAQPVVTVLVNWKGAKDTLECLESLFGSDYRHQIVVVVDNGSGDGSLDEIEAWAKGQISVSAAGPVGVHLLQGEAVKPIEFVRLDIEEAREAGPRLLSEKLYLIDAARNHGFAGGVNIGIAFALRDPHVRYFWVLNNDTVVAVDCLTKMWQRMRDQPGIGMCGSRILYYWDPDRVQVLGGASFQSWLGASRLIGQDTPAAQAWDADRIERQLDHLSGASMLVSRTFVEDVGLMDERYFLYYEEVDWAMRARGAYRLGYEDSAVVFHKEGSSIGSSGRSERRSDLSVYFLASSRLRLTRKMRVWAVPSVVLYTIFIALRSYMRGHRGHARAVLAALRGRSAQEALGWNPD